MQVLKPRTVPFCSQQAVQPSSWDQRNYFAAFPESSLKRVLIASLVLAMCFLFARPSRAQTFGCSPAMANDIVCENSKTGSAPDNWEVLGAGDLTLQGFATDISVAQGTTVSFKINTNARAYTIGIFRLGYYQGMGARQVATISPSATLPQTQPACKTDAATKLYDCGNWAVSASWQVPSNATSGIYLAVLTRTDTGGASQIFFIVRNDNSHSDMLFQTSDESWQAYNSYGGNSLYGGPDTFDLPSRAFKVSYNRPFITRGFGQESATFLFGTEYPLIRWLEANGFDVTYFTGIDAARNGALIKNHKIYLSVGHDEYVSGPQRTNIEAARDAGTSMAFFSGNEFFWKTRLENSIDGSGTPNRTLVCYKETLANSVIDPGDPPSWTGTWRDPRYSPPGDGGRPENSLTGTIFVVNGPGSDNQGNLSIQVPSADGKMRFWRGTLMASLAAGQTATLPAGTLGYEWDVDLDNGARPAGLFALSTATYNLTTDLLLDYGATYGAGSATHHMTMYKAPSGALVFGAGTVQWTWGLDATHDNPFGFASPAANTNMQQATLNLFADMGVQPATLQGGLLLATKSTDTAPPTSIISSPASGSNLPLGSLVTISGTATDAGGGVVGGVEVSGDGGQTWHQANGRGTWSYVWSIAKSGSINIKSRAVDDSGNLETPSAGVTVTVPAPAINQDVNVHTDGNTASASIVSPTFSTGTGNELLLAFITSDYLGGPNTTVNSVSGGGLTWALVVRANVQNGTSEIWRAFAVTPVSNVSVTANFSQNAIGSVTVMSFSGVDTSGTNGSGAVGASKAANANLGAPTATLVTTRNNSWVFGVGNDFDNGILRTQGTSQSIVHQFLTSTGDTYWVQMQNAPTPVSGTTVTMNDTAPIGDRYNFAICEILPTPAPTWSLSGTITPSATGSGTAVTLGPSNATATANASGSYTFAGLANGVYTVTPSKAGYSFTPSSQSVTVNGSTVSGVNFSMTSLPTFVVSGSITPGASGAGASVVLSSSGGGTTTTVTADGSGNYSFPAVFNGSYTVTPSKAGFTFAPTNQFITVNGGNLSVGSFTASAIPTWTISGTVTPSGNGAGATVNLTGSATASVTADASGTYSFSGLANGSYTVTPTKTGYSFTPTSQPVTLNNANATGVNFTAQPVQQTSALAADINVSTNGTASSSTVKSPTFSTAAPNELLLAFVSTDFLGGTNTSVTGVTGGGLTWALVVRTNAQSGTAEIWRAFAPTTLIGASVTATLSQSVVASITVETFTGADPTGTNGSGAIGATKSASAGSGAPTATLVTTRNNSWVFGVGSDFDNAIARTAGSGQSLVNQYLTSAGDTYWVQNQNATTPLSGTSVTINDTAPTGDRYNLSICEILPAVAVAPTYGISGSISPAASGAGTTVSLSGAAIATATADSSGNYSFSGLSSGSYTVTPSKIGFTFTPASQPVTDNGASVTAVNFTTQAIPTYTISGTISPAASGASTTVFLSGAATATATADSSGNYSFAGLSSGSYTVTLAKTGFIFTPASQPVTVNGASVTAVNFTAQAIPTFTISGAISPTASGSGSTVSLTGGATATVTADSSGNYSFPGLPNGTYTVRPSKTGFTFNPINDLVIVNGVDQPGINFTIAAIPTYSISGSITPSTNGAGATLALSGSTVANATADASGNYTFTGVPSGSYVVTPSQTGMSFTPSTQSVTVNGGNVPAINFTAQVVQPASLLIDATVAADQNTASTTIKSPAFSTAFANEVLLAFVATDFLGSGSNTVVNSISGGGLTWVLVVRANTQSGDSEIWRGFAPSVLSNATVTATLSNGVASSITVMSFAGADITGSNGSGAIGITKTASAASGAPTALLATTRANSWVLGVGNDYDNAIARTVGTGQTMVHQFLSSAGDTYWVQRQNAPTPVSGTSVTINDTAPTTDRYDLAIVELLPSLAGGTGGTPPTVSMLAPASNQTVTNKATVTANASSTTSSISGVQFLLDGSSLGPQVTGPPYSMTWDTTTTTAGNHTLSATAYDATGLNTSSSPITVKVDNSGNSAIVGSWSAPVTLPTVAVNLVLLKNNSVLFYQDGNSTTVWDYTNNRFTSIPAAPDLFCSGHAALPDGRILVVGGYGGSASKLGIANAEIFDPAANTWTVVPNMAYERWYPTATPLSDGRILVTAGWRTTSHSNAGIPEIYDPTTNKWTQLTTANNPFETYPFIFQLPDGRVLHVGGTEYATVTDVLNLTTNTWSSVDARLIDGGSATMYLPNKILKAGSATDSQNAGSSSNTAYVLDMTQSNPMWQQVPSMAYPRSFLNLTELPDGTVLATGGETDKNGGNIANAVYAAELWSPATQTWTTMASMHTPREYHSTALLLPDGRVLQSGMGADFGNVPDEMSAEFYSPPYLFKGARPSITSAPTGVSYGSNFFVGTPDGAAIASAVLIRTGATTHFFDENTHFVPVTFTQTTGGLNITAPANGNAAPPGHYMLFLVNGNGVPSIAPILQLHP
jgi:hypothetical protein